MKKYNILSNNCSIFRINLEHKFVRLIYQTQSPTFCIINFCNIITIFTNNQTVFPLHAQLWIRQMWSRRPGRPRNRSLFANWYRFTTGTSKHIWAFFLTAATVKLSAIITTINWRTWVRASREPSERNSLELRQLNGRHRQLSNEKKNQRHKILVCFLLLLMFWFLESWI